MLKKVFGKKDKGPTPQEAIAKLRDMEEMLLKKQEFLEKKMNEQQQIARQNANTNKKLAMKALKTKKNMEKQVGVIDGSLQTIEFQRNTLENSTMNISVLEMMREASQAMNKANKGMKMEDVDKLMDDIQEQHEIAKEMGEVISNPIGFSDGIDMDDLEKELEDLQQEEVEKQIITATPVPRTLPAVPAAQVPASAKVAAKKKKVEDDLSELESWAAA